MPTDPKPEFEICDRSCKKFRDFFSVTADKLWNCYEAATKASFSQRVRRLCEWAENEKVPDVMLKPIEKLKENLSSYSEVYDQPGFHRTSNMVDRLMPENESPFVLDLLLSWKPVRGRIEHKRLGVDPQLRSVQPDDCKKTRRFEESCGVA
ncbi:conserved uncharacterized protein [Desulfococcus multivorans]|nr:conserved uncharacterized protein [Desulfococcus multivorans]